MVQGMALERPKDMAVKAIFLGLVIILSIALILNSTQQTTEFRQAPPLNVLSSQKVTANVCGKLPKEVMSVLIHYATTNIIPQQNAGEIALTRKVLETKGPLNMLVFGLGHDSLLWRTLNHGGKTVFLEEDANWMKQVAERNAGLLEAYHVKYQTYLKDSDALLEQTISSPACAFPLPKGGLGESQCLLSLKGLPEVVLKTEWDVIMVDAPRGYFPEAPGRMSAIYSAAVLARSRRKSGVLDVFLHDVDRPVERKYAKKFLCAKYRSAMSGRLWHFGIPPTNASFSANDFCL